MKEIIVRADDLGYSEAVNYGIAKTIREGIVKSAGVMVNMDAAPHGLNLLRGLDVCLGLHTNICAGKPVSPARYIPSLIGEGGEFHGSRIFRQAKEDFISLDEVILEIEAQYERFTALTGQKPDYFEGHAVQSRNFCKGLEIVARQHSCDYLAFDASGKIPFRNSLLYLPSSEKLSDKSALKNMSQAFIDTLELYKDRDTIEMYICHPGYLDQYLMEHSSLTERRAYEVQMLCDTKVIKWLKDNQIKVIKYSEVK